MSDTKDVRGSVRSKRSPYWDNIKGVLILLVVFAHILGNHQDRNAINRLYDCIYMFHMPAFVFVSGYFGKSRHAGSFASIARLALLFFIFNGITGFLCGFGSLLVPVLSFWFLLALIGWRLTAPRIAGFRHVMPVLWIISILAGFYPSVDNTLGIVRFLCFYPFYMMGYLLPQERAQKAIHRTPPDPKFARRSYCWRSRPSRRFVRGGSSTIRIPPCSCIPTSPCIGMCPAGSRSSP